MKGSDRSPFGALSLLALFGLCATLLGGCTDPNCASALCGCWEQVDVELDILVVDAAGEPVSGVSAICINEDAAVAVTGVDGRLLATFESRVSPGCGVERCASLTILDPSGRCDGVESSLNALNLTTVTLSCAPAR